MARQSRDVKKLLAAKRAQFKLEQNLDYIDFVEDELVPIVEAERAGKAKIKVGKTNAAIAASAIKVNVKELPKGE